MLCKTGINHHLFVMAFTQLFHLLTDCRGSFTDFNNEKRISYFTFTLK